MPDRVVVTSSQSWLSRLGGALKGILFGFLLLAGGIFLLFWGEGRAVKRAKTLKEGAGAVVAVDAARVDPGHDGGLVHLSGEATCDETLTDPLFGVSQERVLRLARDVEMYQWVERTSSETRKKVGGGTETKKTYSYEKEWSSRPVVSSSFEIPEGHANPPFPFESADWGAGRVTVGAFVLGDALKSQLSSEEALTVTEDDLSRVPVERRQGLRVADGRFYHGQSTSTPQVGDVRVGFAVVRPAQVSIVARQQGAELVPYRTKAGGDIKLLTYGNKPAEEMFQAAKSANTALLWALRAGGFLLVFFGFATVLRPLAVLADVIPLVGSLVSVGTGFVAFALAVPTALVTVAIGWIVYRPLLGIALLVLAAAAAFWLVRRLLARKRGAAPVPAAASPAPIPPPPPPPPPA